MRNKILKILTNHFKQYNSYKLGKIADDIIETIYMDANYPKKDMVKKMIKCPNCKSQKTELFNHYYYSDSHHLKKHYKCHTCGFQWVIEEDPLE